VFILHLHVVNKLLTTCCIFNLWNVFVCIFVYENEWCFVSNVKKSSAEGYCKSCC